MHGKSYDIRDDDYKGTKCDFVTEQLKDMIITGIYKAGEKLPNEAALCEKFGVSRVVVREVMKKLSMMGLLDICQGKGTFVKSVDLGLFMKPMYQMIDYEHVDIEAIFDARKHIEIGTVSIAAQRRTEENLNQLEQILKNLRLAIEAEDINSIGFYDSEFHRVLAESAGNPILSACLEAVDEINKTFVVRFSNAQRILQDCYQEHYRIYEAVKRQDTEAAIEAMVNHTSNCKKLLL